MGLVAAAAKGLLASRGKIRSKGFKYRGTAESYKALDSVCPRLDPMIQSYGTITVAFVRNWLAGIKQITPKKPSPHWRGLTVTQSTKVRLPLNKRSSGYVTDPRMDNLPR